MVAHVLGLVVLTLALAGGGEGGQARFEPPRSSEADRGRTPCDLPVKVGGLAIGHFDFSIVLPAWVPVRDRRAMVVEGTVVQDYPKHHGPRVSSEDFPGSHYTHDFCFEVEPDHTPDHRFLQVLGVQEPAGEGARQQRRIEVEWECGLGAGNDGNPAAGPNRRGESAGLFSAGHRRGELLWAWPTIDDWVHVEGQWVWDRGHPPARTEIHPPRLVATRRALPVLIDRRLGPVGGKPGDPVLATRVDVFASGDGGALWNNRPDAPSWVHRVPMREQDYAFEVASAIPRPSAGARLRAIAVPRPGDSFPSAPEDPRTVGDRAHFSIPWKTLGAADTAVFARSYYMYWDEGLGAPADWRPRAVRVTFDELSVHKTQEPASTPAELRVFAEVGGDWLFLNELASVADPVRQGLGEASAGMRLRMRRSWTLLVPPGGRWRVAAGGWEADGVDSVMGHLFNPEQPCDMPLQEWLQANLFRPDVGTLGLHDDPIGEISEVWSEANGLGVGAHAPLSAGGFRHDLLPGFDHDPDGTFRLRYRVEEVPLASLLGK